MEKMQNYRIEKLGKKAERRNYSKVSGNLDLPDLVEVQTQSFEWFIREGIREVFEDIYPEIRRLRIRHAKVYRQRVQIPGGEFRRAIESENGAGNGRQYNR